MRKWLLIMALMPAGVQAQEMSVEHQASLRATSARQKAYRAAMRRTSQQREAQLQKMLRAPYDAAVARGLAYGCPICGRQHNGHGHAQATNTGWKPYMRRKK